MLICLVLNKEIAMEGELFGLLYVIVQEEAKLQSRPKSVQYSDAMIILVFFWAVLHDRPIRWTCDLKNWSEQWQWLCLPSESTVSRRLRTLSCCLLLERIYHRLHAATTSDLCVCRRIDTKPLVVGGFSKDRDARRGYATGGIARGYKIAGAWGKAVVPDTLTLASLNSSDQQCAITLIDRLVEHRSGATGYLLADSTHETNPVHQHACSRGFQLVAKRKQPGTGLGHSQHSPGRLRCIELLESNPPNDFGRNLYTRRGDVERDLGHLCSFGGGLQGLPSWVRRPRRVARWVIAKLIIRGLRTCRNQRLAA
jgi:hypothetical protein